MGGNAVTEGGTGLPLPVVPVSVDTALESPVFRQHMRASWTVMPISKHSPALLSYPSSSRGR